MNDINASMVTAFDDRSSSLATARLHWQIGDWVALAALDVMIPPRQRLSPPDLELMLYKAQGAFQTGQTDLARDIVRALRQAGVNRRLLTASLLSGAHGNLSRAWMLLGAPERATRAIREAIDLHPDIGDPDLVASIRMAHEQRAVFKATGLKSSVAGKSNHLFIDCGGYDGCSALMFLLTHPHYDSVTFEPNPELWKHYEGIPTRLIRKAAYTFDGEVSFTVDPVDGDGSTLIKGKRVDFSGKVAGEDCPVITVPSVDLSAYVRDMSKTYGRIVLKLDVEGAEYDILEKMLVDGTINHVDHLYCEFHYNKMQMDPARHECIVKQVAELVPVDTWDAIALSFNREETPKIRDKRRSFLISAIEQNRRNTELIFNDE